MIIEIYDSQSVLQNTIIIDDAADPNDFVPDGGSYVDVTKTEGDRREEMDAVFAVTIDKMNPVWWDTLSSDEQAGFKAFRKVWLDYVKTGTLETEVDLLGDGVMVQASLRGIM